MAGTDDTGAAASSTAAAGWLALAARCRETSTYVVTPARTPIRIGTSTAVPTPCLFGTIVERSGPGLSGVTDGRSRMVLGVASAEGDEGCASGGPDGYLGGNDDVAGAGAADGYFGGNDDVVVGGADGYARGWAAGPSGKKTSAREIPMPGTVRADADVAGRYILAPEAEPARGVMSGGAPAAGRGTSSAIAARGSKRGSVRASEPSLAARAVFASAARRIAAVSRLGPSCASARSVSSMGLRSTVIAALPVCCGSLSVAGTDSGSRRSASS